MTKEEAIREYVLCRDDYAYYAEKYAKTYNEMVQKKVPFVMFQQQREFVRNLFENRFNIVPKSRQSGISTSTALFEACNMLFKKDRKVLIVAHKRDGAENFLKKIVEFIEDRPTFLKGIKVINKSQSRIALSNGSEARAFASSSDSLRSFTATDLIMDEAAFIPNARTLWKGTSATLSTGGRATFISTPNGMDELFYKTYDQALKGKSDFFITYIRWWRDDRYNKGLTWTKEVDGEIKTIKERDDQERMLKLYKDGWKPHSPWFEEQKRNANYDEKQIAQEYEIEFIGSSDTVVPAEVIKRIETEEVCEPIKADEHDVDIWYYKEPEEGKKYLIASDVASGQSEDSSSFTVVDIETLEVCCDYLSKVAPEALAGTLNRVGRYYNNAVCAVDVSGGIGLVTVVELAERFNYPAIYRSEIRNKAVRDRMQDSAYDMDDGKQMGFLITTANRNLMVQEFVKIARAGEVLLPSARLIAELKVFIYKANGKPEHMRGYHDDLIFAYLIAYYIIAYDFRSVQSMAGDNSDLLSAMLRLNSKESIKSGDSRHSKRAAENKRINSMLWPDEKKANGRAKGLPKHGFIL